MRSKEVSERMSDSGALSAVAAGTLMALRMTDVFTACAPTV